MSLYGYPLNGKIIALNDGPAMSRTHESARHRWVSVPEGTQLDDPWDQGSVRKANSPKKSPRPKPQPET